MLFQSSYSLSISHLPFCIHSCVRWGHLCHDVYLHVTSTSRQSASFVFFRVRSPVPSPSKKTSNFPPLGSSSFIHSYSLNMISLSAVEAVVVLKYKRRGWLCDGRGRDIICSYLHQLCLGGAREEEGEEDEGCRIR